MSGNITRRGKNSWRLKFDIGRFRGTRKAAQNELIRLVAEYNAGTSVDPSKITVSDYLAEWHANYAVVQRHTQNGRAV